MLGEGFEALIEEARMWVMDCVENPEDVEDASGQSIMNYVRRNYEGGWKQFVRDMNA